MVSGASGSLVDDVRDFRTRGPEALMINCGAPAVCSPVASLAALMITSAPNRLRAALLLVGVVDYSFGAGER
jgi:hypothetical protein